MAYKNGMKKYNGMKMDHGMKKNYGMKQTSEVDKFMSTHQGGFGSGKTLGTQYTAKEKAKMVPKIVGSAVAAPVVTAALGAGTAYYKAKEAMDPQGYAEETKQIKKELLKPQKKAESAQARKELNPNAMSQFKKEAMKEAKGKGIDMGSMSDGNAMNKTGMYQDRDNGMLKNHGMLKDLGMMREEGMRGMRKMRGMYQEVKRAVAGSKEDVPMEGEKRVDFQPGEIGYNEPTFKKYEAKDLTPTPGPKMSSENWAKFLNTPEGKKFDEGRTKTRITYEMPSMTGRKAQMITSNQPQPAKIPPTKTPSIPTPPLETTQTKQIVGGSVPRKGIGRIFGQYKTVGHKGSIEDAYTAQKEKGNLSNYEAAGKKAQR